uniref:ATP synthase complex subunit 8 n=1 Tax=Chaoborus sp. ZK-2019 TaxID=2527953 RepID=A0A411NHG8_9DIPT|nr:ATP synthase F0 subunit 8 [Chaoborus sp. ZK-2019]
MPQMAPMNWLILFIFFFSIFILFNFFNFYISIPQKNPKKSNYFYKTSILNWKW